LHIWREHKKNPNPKNPSLPNQLVEPTWQNKKSSRTPSGFGIFFFLGRSLSPATISFSQSLPLSPAKPFLAHRAFLPKPAPPTLRPKRTRKQKLLALSAIAVFPPVSLSISPHRPTFIFYPFPFALIQQVLPSLASIHTDLHKDPTDPESFPFTLPSCWLFQFLHHQPACQDLKQTLQHQPAHGWTCRSRSISNRTP